MHGPKWPFLLSHGPDVVVVICWDKFCTLGRAPRTKETMPDFREWCRVTRHPQVFCRLTGCQRDPEKWGVTNSVSMGSWYRSGIKTSVLDNLKQKFHGLTGCQQDL